MSRLPRIPSSPTSMLLLSLLFLALSSLPAAVHCQTPPAGSLSVTFTYTYSPVDTQPPDAELRKSIAYYLLNDTDRANEARVATTAEYVTVVDSPQSTAGSHIATFTLSSDVKDVNAEPVDAFAARFVSAVATVGGLNSTELEGMVIPRQYTIAVPFDTTYPPGSIAATFTLATYPEDTYPLYTSLNHDIASLFLSRDNRTNTELVNELVPDVIITLMSSRLAMFFVNGSINTITLQNAADMAQWFVYAAGNGTLTVLANVTIPSQNITIKSLDPPPASSSSSTSTPSTTSTTTSSISPSSSSSSASFSSVSSTTGDSSSSSSISAAAPTGYSSSSTGESPWYSQDYGLSSGGKIAIGLIFGLFLPLAIIALCCYYCRRTKSSTYGTGGMGGSTFSASTSPRGSRRHNRLDDDDEQRTHTLDLDDPPIEFSVQGGGSNDDRRSGGKGGRGGAANSRHYTEDMEEVKLDGDEEEMTEDEEKRERRKKKKKKGVKGTKSGKVKKRREADEEETDELELGGI